MEITKRKTEKYLYDLDVEVFLLIQQCCWSKQITEKQIYIEHFEYVVDHNDHHKYYDRYIISIGFMGSKLVGHIDVEQ